MLFRSTATAGASPIQASPVIPKGAVPPLPRRSASASDHGQSPVPPDQASPALSAHTPAAAIQSSAASGTRYICCLTQNDSFGPEELLVPPYPYLAVRICCSNSNSNSHSSNHQGPTLMQKQTNSYPKSCPKRKCSVSCVSCDAHPSTQDGIPHAVSLTSLYSFYGIR